MPWNIDRPDTEAEDPEDEWEVGVKRCPCEKEDLHYAEDAEEDVDTRAEEDSEGFYADFFVVVGILYLY